MITLSKQHRQYEKYRNADGYWLDRVPKDWNIILAKRYASVATGGTPDRNNLKYWEPATIPWLASGEVNKKIITKADNYISEEGFQNSNATMLPINSVLIALNGQGKTKGMTAILETEATCNQSLAAFICDPVHLNYKYLFYYLHSEYKTIRGIVGDNLRDGLSMGTLKKIICPVPSTAEQKSIASYLDEKCALIDSIIAKKQRQIELLQEQRTAIINRAVTKGLDESVEMKESEVEWIGEIPKGWEIKKLKTAFRFEKGKHAGLFTKEYVSDSSNMGEYPVYSGQTEDEGVMGRINTYIYDIDRTIFTTTVGAKVMTPMIIGGKFSLSQNCVLFKKTGNIDVRYFYYQLFPMFKWEKDSIPSHMQPSLRVSDLNKYSVAFPSYEEQVKIADHIDERTAFMDEFVTKIENSISLLSEYKTSLIAHAVTGKIKISPTTDV